MSIADAKSALKNAEQMDPGCQESKKLLAILLAAVYAQIAAAEQLEVLAEQLAKPVLLAADEEE